MINRIKYFLRRPLQLPIVILIQLPYFAFLRKTLEYQNKVNFEFWFKQKVLNWGGNRRAYWPVHWTSRVFDPQNIIIGVDSAPGINGGAYITGKGGITIGNYCVFAKNIIIVSSNHDLYDLRKSVLAPVKIGNYCWLGAGAKIMPGVEIGDHTVVAAGAVVTKSFPEGHCVLGGVPAKKIKELDPEKCVKYEHDIKFYGYLSEKKFKRRMQKLYGQQLPL
jgi:acetyltransferase-like isoleucine patch superfamily enzyme